MRREVRHVLGPRSKDQTAPDRGQSRALPDSLPGWAALAMPVLDDPVCAGFVEPLLRERWRSPPTADELDRFAAQAEGALVFVAVHHGNFPTLEAMATALRSTGRRVVAIYLQGVLPADTYTAAVSCDGSLARFAAFVAALPGRAIYLQAHGRWAFLGQLVAAVRPDLRVVQEVWDWMDAFVQPEHEAAFVADGLFGVAELATIRSAERWIRTCSAGFVHKHGGAALDEVVADKTVPEVRILPCPPRVWQRPPVTAPDGPWRLVHAGQIKPSSSSRRVFGDLHVAPLFADLCAQGMHVTAFAGAMPGSVETMLAEYVALAQHEPRFRIEARRPVAELIAAMHGQHHYGVLLYPFDDDLRVGPRHLQTALASKLFAYVAAGLPILVSPELEFMASFVREHGIGLVVTRAELPRLARILDDSDHAALRDAVARVQPELCIETQLPAVLRLVEDGGS